MTKDEAYKVTTYFYNLGTGASPAPDLGEYWAQRMVDIGGPAIDELGIDMEKQLAARMKPSDYTLVTEQLFKKKG